MPCIFRPLLFACTAALLWSCSKDAPIGPVTPVPDIPVTDSFPQNQVDRTALLQLVNGLRSRGCRCGETQLPPAAPLRWNGALEKAAWLHSKDMQEKNYFDHTGLNGSKPGERLEAAGYNWIRYGENIARGPAEEQSVVLGWLSSPAHCRNMMDPLFEEIGTGRFNEYWTMELGSRK